MPGDLRRWIDAGIGVDPDTVVAKRLGVTHARVCQVRKAHGIPAAREARRDVLLAAETRYGVVPDTRLAAELGVSRVAVAKARKLRGIPGYYEHMPEWVLLLGKRSDRSIARKFGVSVKTVWKRRHGLGIPTFDGGKSGRKGITTEAWLEAGLGKTTDRVVAKRLGVTEQSASLARRRRGIPVFRSSVRPPK